MRGLWMEEGKLLYRGDLSRPLAEAGEALVRVRLAGVCGTDLELLKGYLPFRGVPGHEFVGVVEEAPGQEVWCGRRVVGEINLSCGQCRLCRRGLKKHCEKRRVLGIRGHWGAFAEYLSLPLQNLHEVPEGLPDEKAVFAEPLAAALQVLEQVEPEPRQRIVVVGAGRLGQLIARVLQRRQNRVAVVARHPRARRLLSRHHIPVLEVKEGTRAEADVVVEASGSSQGLDLALQLVRPGGTVILKSTYAGSREVDLSRLVVDEVRLSGSRCGDLRWALEWLREGLIDPGDLVSAVFPLQEGEKAFHTAAQAGVFKVLLQIS